MEGLSMKTYHKELADLKRENFSLKLRIYETETHLQQTSQDSAEDVFQMVVEQELHNLLREKEKELVQIQDQHLAKVLEVRRLQLALEKKDQQLTDLQQKNQQLREELEDLQQQRQKDNEAVKEFTVQLRTLQDRTKDMENMTAVLLRQLQTSGHGDTNMGHKQKDTEEQLITSEVHQFEANSKQLFEELFLLKSTTENLIKALEDTQDQNKTLCGKLEEIKHELRAEIENGINLTKTIEALLQVMNIKDKEIAKLHRGIEDRDAALAKERDEAQVTGRLLAQMQTANKQFVADRESAFKATQAALSVKYESQ